MRKKITLCITLLFITTSALADIRSVPGSYTTIQEAIDNCNDGDVVIVDPGVYYENINFLGKNIVVTGTDPEDPNIIAATIIDGNNNGSVVIFENGESTDAVLTGFTITGGSGTSDDSIEGENYIYWGAGISCKNASPTITCNMITGNAGPAQMDGNNYETWQLGYGGGILCFESEAIISRNIIKNNSAFAGAGVMSYFSEPIISHNLIYDNSATIGGGVVLFGGSLINNTIVGNDASITTENQSGFAGNIYAINDSEFGQNLIINNIICSAKSGGGILLDGYWDNSSFACNNLWVNLPGNYIDSTTNEDNPGYDGRADMTGFNGNISADPLFIDNYHISTDSPCCDAGVPDHVTYSWQRDIDGQFPVMGPCIDIGADEVTANARPVADAGDDQYFDEITERVILDGTGSFDPDAGGTITFQWQQISGQNVELLNPDTPSPEFVPPIEDIYMFELTVFDGNNYSVPDSVMIVVGNRTPVADAGVDQICEPGQQITLNGSSSYDLDKGDILSYSWTQISGPNVELVDPNTPTPSFIPSVEGEYVFELIVNDGTDSSLPNTVTVTCIIGSIPDAYGYRWIDSDSRGMLRPVSAGI